MSNKIINDLLGKEIQFASVLKIKRKNMCKGMLVSFLVIDENDHKCVVIGHSLCSHEDVFDKQVAYEIAMARGIKRHSYATYDIPPSIKSEWKKMMVKVTKYYKGDDIVFPAWFKKVEE